MDKYIKIDTAKKTLLDYIHEFDESRANPDFVRGITYAREVLDRVPLEDVAPVVHGKWETNSDRPDSLICSVCKCGFDMWKHNPHNFCPNCGSKMDGGNDDAAD